MTTTNTDSTNKPVATAVLAMDIISYSKEFDESQARLVINLSDVVKTTLDDLDRDIFKQNRSAAPADWRQLAA